MNHTQSGKETNHLCSLRKSTASIPKLYGGPYIHSKGYGLAKEYKRYKGIFQTSQDFLIIWTLEVGCVFSLRHPKFFQWEDIFSHTQMVAWD